MPKPQEKETEQDYISRFMGDAAMVKDYPDEKQRAAVAYSTWRSNSVYNSEDEWAKVYPFRFIEPGLVNYGEDKTVLVTKPVLDKLAATLVGKPVFNNMHRRGSPQDFSLGNADGIVTRTWFNADDGWYWGEAMVWDPATKANIKNGFSVSCAYDVKDWGEGGVHNNLEYHQEVRDGMMNHLAIVDNPRYERATIGMQNSKNGGLIMKLKFWQKNKPEDKDALELDTEKALVQVANGKEVPLTDLITLQNDIDAKVEAEKKALENGKLADDVIVDLGNGKKSTVAQLKATFLKNAEDDDKKKKEEDEKKNAADKEKEDKKKDEEHENGKHAENALDNCRMCAAAKANALAASLENRKGDLSELEEMHEGGINTKSIQLKRGSERYGSPSK